MEASVEAPEWHASPSFGVASVVPFRLPQVKFPSWDAFFNTLHDTYQLRLTPTGHVSDFIEASLLQLRYPQLEGCLAGIGVSHLFHVFGRARSFLCGSSSFVSHVMIKAAQPLLFRGSLTVVSSQKISILKFCCLPSLDVSPLVRRHLFCQQGPAIACSKTQIVLKKNCDRSSKYADLPDSSMYVP